MEYVINDVWYTILSGELLVKEWRTDLLADPSFFRSMVVVRLPEGLIPHDGPEVKMVDGRPDYNYIHCSCIRNMLIHDYKVEVRESKQP